MGQDAGEAQGHKEEDYAYKRLADVHASVVEEMRRLKIFVGERSRSSLLFVAIVSSTHL